MLFRSSLNSWHMSVFLTSYFTFFTRHRTVSLRFFFSLLSHKIISHLAYLFPNDIYVLLPLKQNSSLYTNKTYSPVSLVFLSSFTHRSLGYFKQMSQAVDTLSLPFISVVYIFKFSFPSSFIHASQIYRFSSPFFNLSQLSSSFSRHSSPNT